MAKITLRDRQKTFVDRSVKALYENKNTLAVANVGFGKSICIGAVIDKLRNDGAKKFLVIQHRDELVEQNRSKAHLVIDNITTSVFDGRKKDFSGEAVFGMIQSLSNASGLRSVKAVDALIIDEAHHCAANSYITLKDHLRELNQNTLIYGVTATPSRGDKKGMFEGGLTNCCDQVSCAEMIDAGFLVKPKTFVIDTGYNEELKAIKGRSDFDDKQVAAILNNDIVTEAVIKQWEDRCKGRQTAIFAGTVEHAQCLTNAFVEAGYKAECIHGGLGKRERKRILDLLRNFELDVIVNCGVLIEGFDFPPISCIILLRKESHHSAYVQMIGRGLRIVDPESFPNVVKDDCIVLDFGTSTLIHGTIESEVNLYSQTGNGECIMKECPLCESTMPAATRTCPMCGYEFPQRDKDKINFGVTDFVMTEVDILNSSPWKWEWMANDHSCRMAGGFEVWAGIFWNGTEYIAVGGQGKNPKLLLKGNYVESLNAADTFLLNFETTEKASNQKKWLNFEPSEKQVDMLKRLGYTIDIIARAGEGRWKTRKDEYGNLKREFIVHDLYIINGMPCSRYTANLFGHLAWNKSKIKELI